MSYKLDWDKLIDFQAEDKDDEPKLSVPFSLDTTYRAFNSFKIRKTSSGRIKPVFFLSKFLFTYIAIYGNI